ncbi:MAG TPA: class I SAM-dependent methyltransferase [Gammaproteobacteria bacterium]
MKRLLDRATQPYRAGGRFAWYFARGKLSGDPVFAGLLELAAIPDGARLLDLGCGQGLLASWLGAARQLYEAGQWHDGWPAPPRLSAYRGVELMASDVARARAIVGESAEVVQGDIRSAPFGKADVVVILDVLHYIPPEEQEQVLLRVREALLPTGKLVLRIGDAAGGLRFLYSNLVDHVVFFLRGHRVAKLHTRTLAEWRGLLSGMGFRVESLPMYKGTPFASTLLIATLGEER